MPYGLKIGALLPALLLGVVSPAASREAPSARPAAPHALVPAASPEEVGFDRTRLKRLDDFIARSVVDGKFAGATTLLARHGRIVSFATYGRKTAGGEPIARDTIFRIYSMTKPVTGVALMMLFEEGRFRLDDPVTLYIPEFKALKVMTGVDAAGRPVIEDMKRPPTMRELMSHTAGFGYGLSPDTPADRIYRENGALNAAGMEQFIKRASQLPLLFQPGTSFQYSLSVDIQGYLVEKLSGQPFGQFLEERIFRPLGMKDTGFSLRRDQLPRLAGLYVGGKNGGLEEAREVFGWPRPDPGRPPTFESGGAGLFSTTMDYARFAQMLLNGGELDGVRILSPATVALMATNALPDEVLKAGAGGFGRARGFGLNVDVLTDPAAAGSLAGKGTYSWGGAAGTWFWIDPANDLIFVGMVQRLDYWQADHPNNMSRTLTYQALTRPDPGR
ncbi:MAG TPA: serine hydrolase domain-containing protein [Allosphingosinicella sp.]